MNLRRRHKKLILALAEGWTLKSHRFVSGRKVYRLHHMDGREKRVRGRLVHKLMEAGYLYTNQKFPAATFLLTDKGREQATIIGGTPPAPLTGRDG